MLTKVNEVIFQYFDDTVANSNNKNFLFFLHALEPPHWENSSATYA